MQILGDAPVIVTTSLRCLSKPLVSILNQTTYVSLICAIHLVFKIKINASHYRPDVEEIFVSVLSILVQIRFVIFSFRESATETSQK